jgi:hypothetical protein
MKCLLVRYEVNEELLRSYSHCSARDMLTNIASPHLRPCCFSEILVIVNPTGVFVLVGLPLRLAAALGAADRLCAMCACTKWPAASAAQRDNSPARTPAATIRASWRAFSPGLVAWAPRTPRRSSIAACGSRTVPPPMVPTSIEGMLTEIWRLPFRLRDR